MSTCSNWFKAKVSMRNTVGTWVACFGVSNAIAKHIQAIAVAGATQKQVEAVVKAVDELCNQVGF